MSDSDDAPMSLRRPHPSAAEPDAMAPSVFASSVPPASVDATLAAALRILLQCAHPEECQSRCTVLEPNDGRLPIRWCGACGAIAVAQGDAVSWTSPGMPQLLLPEAITRWTSGAERLGSAVVEVARATRAFAMQTAERARTLEDAMTALERTAKTVLAELGA